MRLWIWRVVLLGLALVAGFFALTLVLPLTTMGDPTYDIAMLRTRWWLGFGILYVQIAVVIGLALMLWHGAKGWIALALGLTVAGFFVIGLEEGRIIAYGDVVGSYGDATRRLMVSRWATLGLAVAALGAGLLAARRELNAAG